MDGRKARMGQGETRQKQGEGDAGGNLPEGHVLFLGHRKACLEREDRVRGSYSSLVYWLDLEAFQGTLVLEGQQVGVAINPKKGEAFEDHAFERVSAIPPAAHSKPIR